MGANVRRKKEIFKAPVEFKSTVSFADSAGLDFSNVIAVLGADAVAAAGSGQATYTALTKQISAVTGADGTKGVALPAAVDGKAMFIINTSATEELPVAPVNGGNDQINALTAGTGVFTLAPGESAWFVPTSATQWYVASDEAVDTSKVASISWAVTAGAANICIGTFTLKDEAGATLAGRRLVRVYIAEDANGDSVTADSYSTGASVTDGTSIAAVVANKVFDVLTGPDGVGAISITDTGKPADQYFVAVNPVTGAPHVSAASGVLWGA